MTNKELLYIEDALGHEKFIQSQCQQAAGQIQDAELKNCVLQMAEQHRRLYQTLYGLL